MEASLQQRIDFARLNSHLGGDQKVLAELLQLFLKSAAVSIETMAQAEAGTNVILWLQQAHHLKGACKNITAKRLTSLCLEAESITRLPNQQTAAVLYHMHKELALLRETIADYLKAATPL